MLRLTLFATLVAALAFPALAENIIKPPSDGDVVARVGDTAIYRRSVKDIVQGMLALEEKEPDAKAVQQYAKDALESLVDLELLYQESQRRGVTVADAAVDDEIKRTKTHFQNAKAYEQALKAKGLTEVELRRDVHKTMAVNLLLERSVWKDVQIKPEEVRELYEHQRQEFQHPADVRASHILIRVPKDASAAQRAQAKAKAEALLAKLKAGADFAQLARESSEDPGSNGRGGDLGYFSKGDMQEDFEAQALALAPGQISGVVSTTYGFDIIKLTDRREAGIEPLEAVQERIRVVLVKGERQKRQAELTAQLRKQAKIEYGEPL
jgi:peptidyl-prolyl cis-trans isomerase C